MCNYVFNPKKERRNNLFTKNRKSYKKKMQELYTVEEAANYLGVSNKTIYKYIDQGLLKASRLGPRMLRIESFDLINFIKPAN
jgi:excisionase family DNA binding protein